MKAPLPANEADRLANLRLYNILDTPSEEAYDDLVKVASRICGTPVSMISMIDRERQWYKATLGVDPALTETSREVAFCAHNILDPDTPLVVPDMRKDERFMDNPFVAGVPHAIFYAGIPLVTQEGYAIGSLCVIDLEPRELTEEQIDSLRRLARQATRLLDLRLALKETQQHYLERAEAFDQLRDFSHIIAHDLKAPLRNIGQFCNFLEEDHTDDLPADGQQLVKLLAKEARDASRMINGVLKYSEAVRLEDQDFQLIDLNGIIKQVSSRLLTGDNMQIIGPKDPVKIRTSRIALLQILQNLVGNAIKYNDKTAGWVKIDVNRSEEGVKIRVSDNGPGIPAREIPRITSLFYTTDNNPKGDYTSQGVGLSIVSKLVEKLGGKLFIEAQPDQGATFSFTLPS